MKFQKSRLDPRYSPSRKQTLGGEFSRLWLAGIPLVVSLITILVDEVNGYSIRFLASLLLFCSIGLLILQTRKGIRLGCLGSIMFLGGFIFWYSYPALIGLFLPNYQLGHDTYEFIDEQTIAWSIVYLSSFLFSAEGSSFLFTSNKPDKVTYRNMYRKTSLKIATVLALGGCSLGLMSYMVLGSSVAQILNDIFQSRAVVKPWIPTSNLGDTISPFTFMALSAMTGGALILWSATLDKSASIRTRAMLGVIALLVSTIIYFDQGTRSIFVLIVIPPVVVRLIGLWNRSRSRALVMILIATVVGIFLLQFQLLYRGSFSRSILLESLFENWFTLGGTIDFFKETVFAVNLVPAYHDYFRESVILQFIVSPIPRFIWPDKPVSEIVWFHSMSRWNIDIYKQAGNMLPGIVGQFYMSWGWFGPIMVGGVLGWVTKRIDAILCRMDIYNDLYAYSVGIMWCVWIFISYRLLSPVFLYPVLGSTLIVLLSRRIRRKREGLCVVTDRRVLVEKASKSPDQFL